MREVTLMIQEFKDPILNQDKLLNNLVSGPLSFHPQDQENDSL